MPETMTLNMACTMAVNKRIPPYQLIAFGKKFVRRTGYQQESKSNFSPYLHSCYSNLAYCLFSNALSEVYVGVYIDASQLVF